MHKYTDSWLYGTVQLQLHARMISRMFKAWREQQLRTGLQFHMVYKTSLIPTHVSFKYVPDKCIFSSLASVWVKIMHAGYSYA